MVARSQEDLHTQPKGNRGGEPMAGTAPVAISARWRLRLPARRCHLSPSAHGHPITPFRLMKTTCDLHSSYPLPVPTAAAERPLGHPPPGYVSLMGVESSISILVYISVHIYKIHMCFSFYMFITRKSIYGLPLYMFKIMKIHLWFPA